MPNWMFSLHLPVAAHPHDPILSDIIRSFSFISDVRNDSWMSGLFVDWLRKLNVNMIFSLFVWMFLFNNSVNNTLLLHSHIVEILSFLC